MKGLSISFLRMLNPNPSQRRLWHDYTRRAIYLITLYRNPESQPFASPREEVSLRSAHTFYLLPNGQHIAGAIEVLNSNNPNITITDYAILPTHIILLIHKKTEMGQSLEEYIDNLKWECDRRVKQDDGEWVEEYSFNKTNELFEKGFDDRIARRRSDLERFRNYIEDAPLHFFELYQNSLFNKRFKITTLDGRTFEGLGNPLLLDDPQIVSVKVSSKYSPDELLNHKSDWFRTITNGGVLVSPFISGAEHKVMRWALNNGGRVIRLLPNGFEDNFVITPEIQTAMTAGRLLLIAPSQYIPELLRADRTLCMAMNATAEQIAAHQFHNPLQPPPPPARSL